MKDLVLESDILIDFLNGAGGARKVIEEAAEEGLVCLSAVSAAEVMAAADDDKRESTNKLIDSLEVLPVGKEVAFLAGCYWADCSRGDTELRDCIVAATVRRQGAVLVTKGNRKYPEVEIEARLASYE